MVELLLKKIAEALDGAAIPYMVVGGQALLVYGRVRTTRDIDITLGVDTDRCKQIEELCKKLGLRLLAENPRSFAEQTKVLIAEEPDTKIRVDLIFSFTDFEKQAIGRAKSIEIQDYPVKFTSCEDLIIHKILAGRPVDEEDVRSVLAKHGNTVDIEYVRTWLSRFSGVTEFEKALERFEALLKEL